MQRQARTLYRIDRAGRLRLIPDLTAAESEWEPAPRFFLGRTAQGNVWHFRHDLPRQVTVELDALCRSEPPLQVGQEPGIARQIREVLGAGEEYRGPAYLLPWQTDTGQAVAISPDTAHLLLPAFPGTARRALAGHGGPVTAVIENGQAVAVCSSVRQSGPASPGGAAEAGVFTLEQSRGQGYAAQVTALWANLVRAQGRLPLYSTSWENTASQAVAHRLNGQWFGEDWSIK
ncbi:GNAT family N-acetyltransferase [Deinococcus antarcticus]|uniref:GNAT family N-acetyltransferase n=1 Tax=Deinococcus antarcticus TaxID=1298767 RepID=A0ABV8A4B2_9DEIO